MKDIRAIIFDLEGTLLDLAPMVQAARNRVAQFLHKTKLFSSKAYALRQLNDLEKRHKPCHSSSPYYFALLDIAKAIYKDKPIQLQQLLKRLGESNLTNPVKAFVSKLENVYNSEEVNNTQIFPDTFHALQELRQNGYLLILVTLGRSVYQQNKIDCLRIAPFFHKIINEDHSSHEYWFSKLLQEFKLTPNQVACVGDCLQDEIRAANTLGLTTFWMRQNCFSENNPTEDDRPNYQIRFLSQIFTLLHLANLGKDPAHLKIVTIGGGTGLPTVLRGIQTYTSDPTAVVSVTDTGGSSGRIRWNLGIQPPGDIRNALIALANREKISPEFFRIFQHRFLNDVKKSGIFKNDHIGNFLVAALTQQLGNFKSAIQAAGDLLQIRGRVLPASIDNVHICAELENGENCYTEWMVRKPGKSPLKRVYLVSNVNVHRELEQKKGALYQRIDPLNGEVEVHARKGKTFQALHNQARAPQEAVTAILEADIVVIGPGSLFTSIITNLLVPGIQDALLARTQGNTIYICNITTQPGQTDGFNASDHLQAILDHFPKTERPGPLNHIILQDLRVFKTSENRNWHTLLEKFQKDNKEIVTYDSNKLDNIIPWTCADLAEPYHPIALKRKMGDFISHDPDKVSDAICRIYCGLQVPDYWGIKNAKEAD